MSTGTLHVFCGARAIVETHTLVCCADAEEPVRSKPLPPVNPNAPQLTLKGYFTVPHLKQLRYLPDAKLKVCCSDGACSSSAAEGLTAECTSG